MVNPVPLSVQKAWEECNVQVFVLFSFFLQTLLFLLAPFRKRTASLTVTAVIWLAYLLADWVASFAVGLISNNTNKGLNHTDVPDLKYDDRNSDLFAFWASFLLLHLGGPDTITALSLEDNALWLRQLLGLVFQVFAAAYILILSLPSNSVLAPTLFVLVAGIIKYAERMRSMYLVSNDIVFDERVLRGNLFSLRERKEDERINNTFETYEIRFDQEPVLMICVRNLYETYRGFRCRYTGRTVEELKMITRVLLAKNPVKAMEIISIQLNWLYQNLYTKAVVVGSKWGYAVRLASFSALVVASLLFCFTDKSNFAGVNTVITYVLLSGAVFLDSLSLFMLIPADWAFSEICIKKYRLAQYRWVIRFIHHYLNLRRPNWAISNARCSISSLLDCIRQVLFRRWSESVSNYNLIEYTLRERKGSQRGNPLVELVGNIYIRTVTFFGLKDVRDRLKYVSRKPLSEELWDFIVKQVVIEQDYHCRGEWAAGTMYNDKAFVYHRLYPQDRFEGVSYEETIVRNHIATEIWYNATTDNSSMSDDTKRHREFSKALSDYMLYLLVFQPGVVSSVGLHDNETRQLLKEACAKANLGPESDLRQACERIFGTTLEGRIINVLRIRTLEREISWKNTDWEYASKCWAKILIHGAYYSRPESHARLIIGGGELVSHVWLGLAHFHKRLSGASDADIEAWSREKYVPQAALASTSGEKEKSRKGIVSSICCK